MTKIIGAFTILMFVAACGSGGSRFSSSNARSNTGPSALFASGPISQACRSAGRKSASRARCGCVQAVANRSLSTADQKKGAAFFKNPQRAQDTRQSDNAANERFWKRWKAYSNDAARLCT